MASAMAELANCLDYVREKRENWLRISLNKEHSSDDRAAAETIATTYSTMETFILSALGRANYHTPTGCPYIWGNGAECQLKDGHPMPHVFHAY